MRLLSTSVTTTALTALYPNLLVALATEEVTGEFCLISNLSSALVYSTSLPVLVLVLTVRLF
jgi:hypothetical protein